MEIQGKVGPSYGQDGTTQDPRLTKQLAIGAADMHAHFYEQNYRGQLFTACIAAAGVAPGTALGTAPPFTLWNPPNSGKNLVLTKSLLGYISGTLGAGTIVYAQCPQLTAPSSGTALTPTSNQIGNLVTAVGKPYTGSTVQATQTIVRPAFILDASLATTAITPIPAPTDLADGDMILIPGNALSLQGIAAGGSTPLVLLSMSWVEEAI